MEEIMIDGVDVSECNRFNNLIYKRCGKAVCLQEFEQWGGQGDCLERPNCYYKQLKRKEAECEELKKQWKQAEQELEDFVSDNAYLYEYDGRRPDSLDELQECMQNSYEKFNLYKQVLEKIEDKCNKNIKRCEECKTETDDFIEEFDCFEMICEYRPLQTFSKTVLTIIKECKE